MIQQHLLLGFAAWNMRGYYRRGRQVGSQTPETTLLNVAQIIVLAGYTYPRQSYGSTDLDLPFSFLMISHKTTEPVPKPQLALPIQAIQCAAKFYQSKNPPKVSAILDLLTIVFYFLPQPGEYAMTSSYISSSGVQFSCRKIHFFKNGTVVPHANLLEELQEADSARLYLDHQKNGQMLSTMHHYDVQQEL